MTAEQFKALKPKVKKPAAKASAPIGFQTWCITNGIICPYDEHSFHDKRKWRFDYAWPEFKIALEVDGGLWIPGGGRHNRAGGYLKDCEKFNAAAVLGWRVLRVTPQQLLTMNTIEMLKGAMK